jgi:hypothetical protein
MTSLTVDCPPSGFAASDNTLSCSDNNDPAYTGGILLLGPYIAAFKERFPDRSGYPFRKLVNGGPPSGSSYIMLADGTDITVTPDDLPALCTTALSITINGQTIVKNTIVGAAFGEEFYNVYQIPDNFLMYCVNLAALDLSGFTSLVTIGGNFLAICSGFNQSLVIPAGVAQFGANFMDSCYVFNQPITLPSVLLAIGGNFMQNCYAFNRPLTVPAGLAGVGAAFLAGCSALVSPITINCPAASFADSNTSFANVDDTVPAYVQGIPIAGPSAAAILAKFPNSDTMPFFRKLLGGGSSDSYIQLGTGTVPITAADLPNMCTADPSTGTITVNGQAIVKGAIVGVKFGSEFNGVTAIPSNFLAYFNSMLLLDITGFTSIQTIGDGFMYGCMSFNQPCTLPATVTGVDVDFLYGCASLTSVVTINCPATALALSEHTFATPNASDNAYTHGIPIGGPNAAAILSRFPGSASPPYRKLLNGNAASKKRSKK